MATNSQKLRRAAEAEAGRITQVSGMDWLTITQMRNCMDVGNVVAGVICADGHLGYAQSVGGVIAYDKQISISDVGFDIACGNVAVWLDAPYGAIIVARSGRNALAGMPVFLLMWARSSRLTRRLPASQREIAAWVTPRKAAVSRCDMGGSWRLRQVVSGWGFIPAVFPPRHHGLSSAAVDATAGTVDGAAL
jgi:hypothetical protein